MCHCSRSSQHLCSSSPVPVPVPVSAVRQFLQLDGLEGVGVERRSARRRSRMPPRERRRVMAHERERQIDRRGRRHASVFVDLAVGCGFEYRTEAGCPGETDDTGAAAGGAEVAERVVAGLGDLLLPAGRGCGPVRWPGALGRSHDLIDCAGDEEVRHLGECRVRRAAPRRQLERGEAAPVFEATVTSGVAVCRRRTPPPRRGGCRNSSTTDVSAIRGVPVRPAILGPSGGVAEWLRQGPAKPCTRVRFPAPPLWGCKEKPPVGREESVPGRPGRRVLRLTRHLGGGDETPTGVR
jgi:hypothetical protein